MKALFITVLCISQYQFIYCQNVGIGVANPIKAKLEVATALTTNAVFGSTSTGISLQQNWPTIGFNQYRDDANTPRFIGAGYAYVNFMEPSTGNMFWNIIDYPGLANANTTNYGSEITRMSLLENGNMGVGTSQPRGAFDVATNGNIYLNSSPITGASQYLFAPGATVFGPWNNGNTTYLQAQRSNTAGNMNMQIRTTLNGALHDALYINNDGKIGVNTFNATHSLTINEIDRTGIKLIMPDWYNFNWEVVCDVFNGSAGNENACLKFNYNGDVKSWLRPDNGTYYVYSDKRLKTNIENMPSMLDKIMQVRPAMYEVINDNPSHTKSYGFIAQEFKKIFPEFVSVLPGHVDSLTGKGLLNMHGIDYGSISVVAVKAIQEQQQEITAQGDEIKQLKKEIAILKNLLERKADK